MSDSLSHLQLLVDRFLSGDLQLTDADGASETDLPPVNLSNEAVRLAQLGSQLESEYKSGVTQRLDELENLQRSLANLFWHAQQQIEAYGAEENRNTMKLTDIVDKLSNIKNWVEKMEDLMKDEQKALGLNNEENPSANA